MKSKELFHTDWVSLRETDDGYVYSTETRCNGNIIAILPFEKKKDKLNFFAIISIIPCQGDEGELFLNSITGGNDKGDSFLETAKKELREEAGFDVNINEFISLGYVRPSKSADTYVHLFAIDVTNKQQQKPTTDNSSGEENLHPVKITFEKLINCNDALIHSLVLRFLYSQITHN